MSTITDFFSQATPDEAAAQATRGFEEIQHTTAWKKAHNRANHLKKAQHQRQLGTARQQKCRDKKKQADVALGLRDPKTQKKIKAMKLRQPTPPPRQSNAIIDLTNDSGDNAATWTSKPLKKCAPRTNWADPTRWALISSAARLAGYSSPQAIVDQLQKGSSGAIFKTLNRGTVGAWINKDRNGWTQEALDRAARAAAAITTHKAPRVARMGNKLCRRSRFARFPTLISDITEYLTNIRIAGALVTRTVAQSAVLDFIRTKAPSLFDDPSFKCSDAFIRRVLQNDLDWSYRTTTQAAQKLPVTWEDQCLDMAMRLTWNIGLHNIPPELVINADQTGVSYLGTGDKTWNVRGDPQVSSIGKGEKRQFTLMVAITASGSVLPWQAIFKGKTPKRCLPSETACKFCEELGFHFMPGGDKHWSTLECMKMWIIHVIVLHIIRQRECLGLPATQQSILLIDLWAVHRGAPFREWMRANYPYIIVLFIPGGCTGVAQPCDTNVNRTLKHLIKSTYIEYLAHETEKKLKSGVKDQDIVFDNKPATLRDASPAWLLSAWSWLNDHPQVILNAWSKAEFKGWNLSYEFLNSPMCRTVVHERFSEDQAFSLSIVSERPVTNGSTAEDDTDGPDYDDDYAIDPSVLCDIQIPSGKVVPQNLPFGIVELDGALVYAGDGDLTDDDADGEPDPNYMDIHID